MCLDGGVPCPGCDTVVCVDCWERVLGDSAGAPSCVRPDCAYSPSVEWMQEHLSEDFAVRAGPGSFKDRSGLGVAFSAGATTGSGPCVESLHSFSASSWSRRFAR